MSIHQTNENQKMNNKFSKLILQLEKNSNFSLETIKQHLENSSAERLCLIMDHIVFEYSKTETNPEILKRKFESSFKKYFE